MEHTGVCCIISIIILSADTLEKARLGWFSHILLHQVVIFNSLRMFAAAVDRSGLVLMLLPYTYAGNRSDMSIVNIQFRG